MHETRPATSDDLWTRVDRHVEGRLTGVVTDGGGAR